MSKTQTPITQEDVKHIAKLAKLELADAEVKQFASQLGETVDYIAMLDEVDTNGFEPTSQVTGLTSVMREDEPRPSLPTEKVFANTKQKQNGFFKVNAVLEQ